MWYFHMEGTQFSHRLNAQPLQTLPGQSQDVVHLSALSTAVSEGKVSTLTAPVYKLQQ